MLRFEHGVLKQLHGIDTPYSSWQDVLIWARHLSVTGDLSTVGKIFGLPEDEMKDKEGERLIKLFCEPGVAARETPVFGQMPAWFHDHESDSRTGKGSVSIANKTLFPSGRCSRRCKRFHCPKWSIAAGARSSYQLSRITLRYGIGPGQQRCC